MKNTIIIFILIIMASMCACSDTPGTDTVAGATAKRYREGEIREYEGARLDPAVGPRDNSIKGVQKIDTGSYKLKVTGLTDVELSMTYNEVLALDAHERKITLYCVEGWDATVLWKGVLISDIIELAGAKKEADTVIFRASDGYSTALPLETIRSKQLLLAYGANGIELPPELGYPFIVVAEDKYGYKWARWVTEIELSDDEDYLGYWEKAGYSNSADLPE